MNILMALSQKEITGAEVYATTLGNELAGRGHTVTYVSDTLSAEVSGSFIALNFNSRSLARRLWQVAKLIQIIKKHRIQLVHAHSRASGWACFIACKITATPMVTTVHGRQPVHASRKAFHAFGYKAVAVCEEIKDQIISQLGVASNRVCMIPNPVNEKVFSNIRLAKDVSKIPTISIIGRLTGPKGELCFRLLSDVFQCAIKHQEIRLQVISASAIPKRFDRFREAVEFLSLPQGIPQALGQTDLVIGSGRVAMEALFSGVPVYAIGEAHSCGFINLENFSNAARTNFGDVGEKELDVNFELVCSEINSFVKEYQTSLNQQNFKINKNKNESDEKTELQARAIKRFGLGEIVDQIESLYQDAYVHVRKREIPILMYHRFVAYPSERGIHGTWIDVRMFEKHLKLIQKLGFETLTFRDLKDRGLIHRFSPGKKFLMITADDGYRDNLSRMLPLLQKYQMKATVYVVSGETHNRWDADHPTNPDTQVDLLTPEEIRSLDRSGCVEIGGHTLTHAKLDLLEAKEQQKEILGNKHELEKILNHDICSFAYPFGYLNESAKKQVQQAGYSFAVATDSGPYALHEDLFQIRRIGIFPRTTVAGLKRKIKGNYVWRR